MKKIVAKRIKFVLAVLVVAFVILFVGHKVGLDRGIGGLSFAPSAYMDYEESVEGGFGEKFSIAQDAAVSRSAMVMPAMDGALTSANFAEEVAARSIIKNGNLDLIVVSVEETVTTIKSLVEALPEGFVAEASIQEITDGQKTGWVRLRVPSENFDFVLEQLKGLAVRVESENVQADDVTRQVVDTEARLSSLRAQEEQFTEILRTAATVEDVLKVTEQLNRVRNEIEQYELQLKNLEEEVSLSTIFVSLTDEGNVKILGIYWRPLLSVKQAVRDALENVTGSVDFLFDVLFNLPLLLVWGLILWAIYLLGKKFFGLIKKKKWF